MKYRNKKKEQKKKRKKKLSFLERTANAHPWILEDKPNLVGSCCGGAATRTAVSRQRDEKPKNQCSSKYQRMNRER